MNSQETNTATEQLASAAKEFAGRIVFTTSFGAEDQVITDIISREGLGIPIATLDTGRLFPEAYELWARTEERYGLRVRAYTPERGALEELVNAQGIAGYRRSLEGRHACCAVRKLEPLSRALAGAEAWVTGLRREQSVTRTDTAARERDEVRGLWKINPLADWSEQDVWNYIRAYDVPYNPLHDVGYPSIGCACCTRAVKRTEGVRAGRWWWEQPEHKECGLHNRPRH